MIYLDTNAFDNETIIKSLNLRYDSTNIPNIPAIGDVILTDPFHANDWAWLPRYVLVKVMPDETEVERVDVLKWKLKQEFPKNNTYFKKPPSERSKNYESYHAAVNWADEHNYQKITVPLGQAPHQYSVVVNPNEIPEMVSLLEQDWFALDYEYDPNERIIGIGLANRSMAWYVEDAALACLLDFMPILLQCEKKVAHFSKAEYRVTKLNLDIGPLDYPPFHDPNTMAWILECGKPLGKHDLKSLTETLLKRPVIRFLDIAPDGDIRNVPQELRARYASADPRNTLDIFFILKEKLEEEGLWKVYDEIDRPVTPVLVEMEMYGIRIDRDELENQVIEQNAIRWQHEEALRSMGYTGSLTAPEQVGEWFYGELGLPILEKTQRGGSVAQPVLHKLLDHHPAVQEYIDFGESNKLLSTFLNPIYALGVDTFPFSLQQTSTRTGRLSSTAYQPDPERNNKAGGDGTNMQNWPWKVRGIVVPDKPGYKVAAADFSSEEPRIVAKAAKEPGMLADFEAGRSPYINLGIDLGFDRERVSNKASEGYKVAKTVFLAWLYGGSGFKMSEICARDGIRLSPAECDQYSNRLKTARPALARWRESVIQDCLMNASVRTLFGRRRIINQIYSSDPSMRLEAERWAINMVPQGSGGDIIKKALSAVVEPLRHISGRLFMTVHDEIDMLVPEGVSEADMAPVIRAMCEVGEEVGLELEASIKFGRNWYEAHG